MGAESEAWTWNSLLDHLRQQPANTVAQIPISALPEPTSVGFQSLPVGADGHPVFGGAMDAELGVVVRAIGELYEVNLFRLPQQQQALAPPVVAAPVVRPVVSPVVAQQTAMVPQKAASQAIAPVRVESRAELVLQTRHEHPIASYIAERPGETLLATTAIGVAIGYLIGGPRGALAGAIAGAGTGLASVALSTAATSPVTANISGTMFLALVANGLGGRAQGPVLRLPPVGRPLLLPAHHDDDDEPPHPRRKPRKR